MPGSTKNSGTKMTEIQRLLTNTIEELNEKEKRDNRPRFSISFIRNHPWLFVAMYAAFLATLIVMLRSETLVDSVWLLIVLFVLPGLLYLFDKLFLPKKKRTPVTIQ